MKYNIAMKVSKIFKGSVIALILLTMVIIPSVLFVGCGTGEHGIPERFFEDATIMVRGDVVVSASRQDMRMNFSINNRSFVEYLEIDMFDVWVNGILVGFGNMGVSRADSNWEPVGGFWQFQRVDAFSTMRFVLRAQLPFGHGLQEDDETEVRVRIPGMINNLRRQTVVVGA